jgi:hypothetical protein
MCFLGVDLNAKKENLVDWFRRKLVGLSKKTIKKHDVRPIVNFGDVSVSGRALANWYKSNPEIARQIEAAQLFQIQ